MTDPQVLASLANHPFTSGLSHPHLAILAGCARTETFQSGKLLVRDGGTADAFYLIESGRVAIEIQTPDRGVVRVQTLDRGEVVGWSWLIAPYRWQFDARVVEQVHAIALDASCLRAKCEQEHELGYQLLQRLVAVITGRLSATRLQLLDIYR